MVSIPQCLNCRFRMTRVRIFVCNPALRDNLRRSFGEPPRREGREEVLVGSFRSWKKDSGSEQTKPCRAVIRYSVIAFGQKNLCVLVALCESRLYWRDWLRPLGRLGSLQIGGNGFSIESFKEASKRHADGESGPNRGHSIMNLR